MTTYKDWTPEQRAAVGYAFQAWVENQYDDMAAGGGQDREQLDDWTILAQNLGHPDRPLPDDPPLTASEIEAIENSVWNILDDSGALPGDPEWWTDEVDPEDLRQAMRVAGWAETWGQPD